MNLKEVIRSSKADIDTGKWADGHIPRAAFPLSKVKEKAFKLGKAYSWRLVKFNALGSCFRILIILNKEKEILRCRLGMEESGDMKVLCEHEFHSSEPGWHCHFTQKDVSLLTPGVVRTDLERRRPKVADPMAKFTVTKDGALTIAAERYGLPKGTLL